MDLFQCVCVWLFDDLNGDRLVLAVGNVAGIRHQHRPPPGDDAAEGADREGRS
jgi:hypothetical protein